MKERYREEERERKRASKRVREKETEGCMKSGTEGNTINGIFTE